MERGKRARRHSARFSWPVGKLGVVLGVVMTALTLFVFFDVLFGRPEPATRLSAYAPVLASDSSYERTSRAIRSRITFLLRPREGNAGIGRDPSARRIEAGLLYGRLALLEETHGNLFAARSDMAKGVSLLKAARHPTPTEEHIRAVIAQQDARRPKR
jgi:hypothetical protein